MFGYSVGPDTLALTRTGINGAVVFDFDELPVAETTKASTLPCSPWDRRGSD